MASILKFVKRGQAPVAVIPEEDLAAHAWGEDTPKKLTITRQQELELPREVAVTYISPSLDLQQNTQRSQRMTGDSVSVSTLELAVTMTDAKAKQVADVNLYNAWSSRTTYQFQLSRKWQRLEVTDVVDVLSNGVYYRLRLTKKDDSRPGILKFEAVQEDIDIYAQSGTAAAVPVYTSPTLPTPVPATVWLLDIPLLLSSDEGAGFYMAMFGATGWKGGVLYRSYDGGSSYQSVADGLPGVTVGATLNVLGNYAGGNTFDELNWVDVRLQAGELSSVTQLAVLNSANAALIGSEVVQFKNAELIDTDTYRLTGLLRGRKGTDWAMPLHIAGERFVFLNSNLVRVSAEVSSLGLLRKYKAVSIGMTLDDATAQDFTNTGRGLKPFSPILISQGRGPAGEVILDWTYRSRYGGTWRDNVDVALTETSEVYDLEVWDHNFLSRKRSVLNLTDSTWTYALADQQTDFGEIAAVSFGLKIYQRSAIVGRGVPLARVVQVPAEGVYLPLTGVVQISGGTPSLT